MAIKSKKHEKLEESNIQRVIGYLESDTPITKKEACQMLNISYNTTRLTKIIEEYKEIMDFRARRKELNRGKRATDMEVQRTVQAYLEGEPVSDIAKSLYRSPTFIKNIVERIGVPTKRPKTEQGMKSKMGYLPDECVSDEFEVGEKVWCTRYDLPARIMSEGIYSKKHDCKVYHVYVIELTNFESPYFGFIKEGGFHAHYTSYDLGSLKHLEQYGARI